MVQRVSTVAFEGIEARSVDVQVQVAPGLPAFAIVRCQWQIDCALSRGERVLSEADLRFPKARRPRLHYFPLKERAAAELQSAARSVGGAMSLRLRGSRVNLMA
jgi:hypothetical protein